MFHSLPKGLIETMHHRITAQRCTYEYQIKNDRKLPDENTALKAGRTNYPSLTTSYLARLSINSIK